MLNIPYGKSDFKTMIEENYFYQDRTIFIETLENYGPTYLAFMRPRRFGKSLLISTLHYYYGIQYKNDFTSLFSKTYIGTHPTKNANNYMVLNFDFSGINTNTAENTFEGFLNNVKKGVETFLENYNTFFSIEQRKAILANKDPNEVIQALFHYQELNRLPYKIYVLIDEYDHFANELIAFNYNFFSEMVSQNGFVRKFYEVIKTATGRGSVERIFITGVAPITIDSLTSGFNISMHITLSPVFHQMIGFEESEVVGILKGIDIPEDKISAILEDLRLWYNGYLFHKKGKNKVYNPNMVLYFAQKYIETQSYPDEMLDANVASDYTKIRKLFKIQGDESQYLEVLEELSEKGEVSGVLVYQYSLERKFGRDDLVSLLFYMGFLSIKGEDYGRHQFIFPNYVIKKLYSDYFLKSFTNVPNTLLTTRKSTKLLLKWLKMPMKNPLPNKSV